MAIAQTKDGRWYVYYNLNGRRKKEYFGRGALAEAQAITRNIELGFQRRRPTNHSLGPSFAELALAYSVASDFNANSRKQFNIRLEANILPFFGRKPALKITDTDMIKYVNLRRVAPIRARNGTILRIGVKNSTITREITDIKAILNWAVGCKPPLLAFNPVAGFKKPKSDYAVISPPTASETDLILKAASPHLRRAIKLSWYTGCRPGAVELLSMTWHQFDFDARTILLISADKGGPPSRLVPIMHDKFLKELKEWNNIDKKNGQVYVIHYHGKPIKKIGKAWAGTLKRAGITRRLRPYDLRHNFITRALEAGADLKAVADVVGSRPETIMRHYEHVTTAMHRQTVALIPEIRGDFGDINCPQNSENKEN